MSKYDPLWFYHKEKDEENCKLTFAEIEKILGFKIDHSFLMYKKESANYGYVVGKISLKEKTLILRKPKK